MVTQVSDFGYSSPKQLEGNERKGSKSDSIGGNSISNITGKKKEISPSEAMLIGTVQVLARAGQLDQRQIAGIGAGLRAPSFNRTPKTEPDAKKVAEGDKAKEKKGGIKVNVGEEPEDAEKAELLAQFKAFKAGQEAADETDSADAAETT